MNEQNNDIQAKEHTSDSFKTELAELSRKAEGYRSELKKLTASIRTKEKNIDKKFKTISDLLTSKGKENDQKLKKLLETVATAEKESTQKLNSLTKQIDEKQKEINALIKKWDTQQASAQKNQGVTFTKWQKKAEENFQKYVQEVIKEKTADFEKSKQDFSKKMTESNAIFLDDMKKANNDAKLKGDESLKEFTILLSQKKESFDNDIAHYIQEATEKYQKILELYAIAADNSVAGSYKQSAKEEKKAADRWRIGAILFTIFAASWIGILYVVEAFVEVNTNQSIWQTIKAFSMTGVLLSGAFFSARQSNQHRMNAARKQWFALETKAFDPFVDNLETDDQRILKIQLIDRLFGQQELTTGSKKVGKINEYLINLIKRKEKSEQKDKPEQNETHSKKGTKASAP